MARHPSVERYRAYRQAKIDRIGAMSRSEMIEKIHEHEQNCCFMRNAVNYARISEEERERLMNFMEQWIENGRVERTQYIDLNLNEEAA